MRTDRTDASPPRYFINSIARAFAVLEAFSSTHPRLSLSDLSHRSGLNKATVRRFALTFCDLGYMRQDVERHFSLTPKVLDLGSRFLQTLSLPEVAEPHLARLAEQTHESVNLAIRDGTEVLYVLRITGAPRILTVNLHVGSRLPVHATSLGKALLMDAHDRARLVEALHDPPWPAHTRATRTEPEQLLADLEDARRLGCALADGELEAGLRSIAAPVRNASGAIVAAVNISTHSLRVPLEQLLGPLRTALLETTAAVSQALGYREGSI